MQPQRPREKQILKHSMKWLFPMKLSSQSRNSSNKVNSVSYLLKLTLLCLFYEYDRKHVKEQKTKKEEVSRGSRKALDKVGEEVETLKNILSTLANNIQHHSSLVYKLKHDAAIVKR